MKASAVKVRLVPAGSLPRVPLHWLLVLTSSAVRVCMSVADTVTRTEVTSAEVRACAMLPNNWAEPVVSSCWGGPPHPAVRARSAVIRYSHQCFVIRVKGRPFESL